MPIRRPTPRNEGDLDRKDAGLTLVELLVVLAILALVATLAAPQVLRYLGGARTDTARSQIANIVTAVELYQLDTGTYPTTEQGLKALMEAPAGAQRWRGPYLKRENALTDPWGRPYLYKAPGSKADFDISTLGRDGQPGGTGEDQDVGSWN